MDTIQANLSPRANPGSTTPAGITLAIILGSVVGGLAVIFAVMGIWLYIRYRRLKREAGDAVPLPPPAEDGRSLASVDTVIDYSTHVHVDADAGGGRGPGHELSDLSAGAGTIKSSNGMNGNENGAAVPP